MTCIVGYTYKNKVYIGGDSAGSDGWRINNRKDPKVFKNGNYIIGFTSSFRMGQLLMFNDLPNLDTKNLYKSMINDFIPAVRKIFKDNGYSKINDNVETSGTFLVAYRDTGRLFCIENDYQVGESMQPYNACGCGYLVALGALHAVEKYTMAHNTRVRVALKAASDISNAVRGPFTIMNI